MKKEGLYTLLGTLSWNKGFKRFIVGRKRGSGGKVPLGGRLLPPSDSPLHRGRAGYQAVLSSLLTEEKLELLSEDWVYFNSPSVYRGSTPKHLVINF